MCLARPRAGWSSRGSCPAAWTHASPASVSTKTSPKAETSSGRTGFPANQGRRRRASPISASLGSATNSGSIACPSSGPQAAAPRASIAPERPSIVSLRRSGSPSLRGYERELSGAVHDWEEGRPRLTAGTSAALLLEWDEYTYWVADRSVRPSQPSSHMFQKVADAFLSEIDAVAGRPRSRGRHRGRPQLESRPSARPSAAAGEIWASSASFRGTACVVVDPDCLRPRAAERPSTAPAGHAAGERRWTRGRYGRPESSGCGGALGRRRSGWHTA